jgi:hypothetical protein
MNRTNRMRARIAGSLLALALLVPATLPTGAQGARASASPYYEPCGRLDFKGTHKLMHHVVGCAKASRKAKYVLKNHRAPKGWKCSLDNLSSGYAACGRGQKAFALFPA